MAQITLEVITQEKHLLKETVDQVTAPAVKGEVTILPKHIPLFTKLNDGILRYKKGGQYLELAVTGGFMDVSVGDKVTILADSAIRAEDVSEAQALEAKKRAEEAMENKQSEVEFRQAEAALRKALLELKVARRKAPRSNLPSNE